MNNIGKILVVCAGVVLLQGIFLEGIFIFLSDTPSDEAEMQASPVGDYVSNGVNVSEVAQRIQKPIVLNRFSKAREELLLNGGEFLEINFSQGKVMKYRDGKVVEEALILAKGDPQGWGGTPAGIYSVLYKNQNSFSSISQVYMPYAVHFYGKYFLHGEPYYPSGQKIASDVSGGCIRLENANARAIYASLEQETPVLVVDRENDGYVYEQTNVNELPSVSATSYLIADVDSGFVFAEENSLDVLPIASITKLMTSLVVAENVDLRKSVEVTEQMLEAYGETQGLEEGKRYRVVELFYPMLVASSNDAAEVVAGFLGRDRTIHMMNEKAASMILEDTTFTDPSGFDGGNVSTAQDIFYLARYILYNRPPLWEITRGKDVRSFGEAQFARRELWNKNLFVADESFVGGKTGYSTASKHTGVFLFQFLTKEQDTRTIAFVVLGSNSAKLDIQRLYSWLMQAYQLEPLHVS